MPRPAKDLTNQRFGKLVALQRVCKYPKNNSWMWHCVCDCGNETLVQVCALTSGNTASCGCGMRMNSPKHGMSHSSEYSTWRRILRKNLCPDEWSEFLAFVLDVGCKPSAEHYLWRRDFTKKHGKNNSYWRHPDDTDTKQAGANGYIDLSTGTFGLPRTAERDGARTVTSVPAEQGIKNC